MTVLYLGRDIPDTVYNAAQRFSPIIGQHYFGDLLDGSTNLNELSSYYGISYFFYSITDELPYRIVFFLFVLLVFGVCALSLRRWMCLVENNQKNMVYALHFSYPFVFAADRGQMHLLIGYLFALGLSYVANEQTDGKVSARGQLALGAAFSIKLFPVIAFLYLPKFWSMFKWKFLILSFFGLLFTTAFFKPHIFSSIFGDQIEEVDSFSRNYFLSTLKFNSSLRALIFSIGSVLGIDRDSIFDLMNTHFNPLYFFYVLVVTFLVRIRNIRPHERALVGAILSISIAPIAHPYAQTIIVGCALWSLTESKTSLTFRSRLHQIVVLISVIPLNLPLYPDSHGQKWFFQSIVVPLAQHTYVITLCCVAIVGFFRERATTHV